MLVWLGVTGTVLALIGLGIVGAIVWAVIRFERRAEFQDDAQDAFLDAQKQRMAHEDVWLKDFRAACDDHGKVLAREIDRFAAEWKQASQPFAKSEQELADNLAALLREIKVAKAFAAGSMAMVEQNVAAVDKLWQVVQMIRQGPRTPTNLSPSDEQIAARERGENPEQQAAIDAMLRAASERTLSADDLQ